MSDTDQSSDSSDAAQTPNPGSAVRALRSDAVFGGILSTQFLGAFNDNFFKQLVLLQCAALATPVVDRQPLALAAFALPFVLLSGLGGYISDRFSKRTVIVWCKVAEIAVMAAALLVLFLHGPNSPAQLPLLIVVLAFMGAQSAIFGPSKYGILPELFSSGKLLPVNGAIQMTTFIAIIFGMAGAGIALDNFDDSLWLCSMIAVGIAVLGTGTSLFIRPTPVAEPQLKLKAGNLFIPGDIWRLFRSEPQIARAILVMMLFWFIGGVAQPAVNTLGENVFSLSKTRTSLMAASIGIGIAIGCVVSGFANKSGAADGARWTTRGGWMIVGSLLLISLFASGVLGGPNESATESADQVPGILYSIGVANVIEWSLRLSMFLLGISAGIFVIPIQVYVQETPPPDQKGRLIGAMNFVTWIGILLSAAFLQIMNSVTRFLGGAADPFKFQFVVFLTLAVLMAPVALLYRLPSKQNVAARSDDEKTVV
ncbi:MAG TPA: MFS transporter [Planctomycetes bacterium]|nr:MFS transporter [Fuerstiella sp.]HIK91367.1 MFS transporter [Planctomycetota bacterium]